VTRGALRRIVKYAPPSNSRSTSYSRPKGVESVSDKDADAKNDQKCCKSFEHGDPKDCSSKSLRSLHSQNYSPVAPSFSARLMIPGNSPTDCFPD
jgi:hypothetical protein